MNTKLSAIPTFLSVIALSVVLSACDQSTPEKSGVEKSKEYQSLIPEDKSAKLNRSDKPLLIAPMIEGLNFCNRVFNSTMLEEGSPHVKFCEERQYNLISELQALLFSLEPEGAQGNIQVGYTYGVPLLNLYDKVDENWVLNADKIEAIFETVKAVGRPIVLYPMMNHFDSGGGLAKELMSDHTNLMLLSNGEPPLDTYFEGSIAPYTLSIDEKIPVNQYRFDALRALFQYYARLPEEQKALVHAFSLGGEFHHLFENFQTGTGQFEDVRLTDYSENSKSDFRAWLKGQYNDLKELNARLESNYSSWEEIEPPSKNIRSDKLVSFSEHVDSYAHGILPVFGWLWNNTDQPFEAIDVYVDGNHMGAADYHLNRMDVYQALEELQDPNVGFRYALDFSALKPGIHQLQVVATIGDEKYELTKQKIVYVDKNQAAPKLAKYSPLDNEIKPAKALDGLRFYMDHPRPLQDVYYNPLAELWNTFRESQVETLINYVWLQAMDSGAEQGKLYSHQIPPSLNSSWNTVLFAANQTIAESSKYLPGITLYGGGADGVAAEKLYPAMTQRTYGVPEFHPQQYKSFDRTYDALMIHYYKMASFVTPYYMSVAPEYLRYKNPEHARFLLEATNESYGSQHLYRAVVEAAQY